MRKLFFLLTTVIMLAISGSIGGSNAETEWEGLSWMYRVLGENINPQLIDEIHQNFHPVILDCGDVQIVLREILYDGIWMYTAATAIPTKTDVILMPESAAPFERIAGGYGENYRDDPRTFQEAAIEENKELLIVEAYPIEYDDVDVYFLDHRQDAGVQSTLFSGAEIPLPDGLTEIHFHVNTYRASPVTGEVVSNSSFEFPVSFIRHGYEKKVYAAFDETPPFSQMTLTRTAIATYVLPEWKDERDIMPVQLLTPDGIEYPHGNPDDAFSFQIEEFPQIIAVCLEGSETVYLFYAVD